MTVPIYKFFATKVAQIKNLEEKPEKTQQILNRIRMCNEEIENCIKKYLPSGAGFDSGTKLLVVFSTPEKLMFRADFHHMDDNGFYMGWSEHVVTVKSSLAYDILITVSGRNVRDIKEYILDTFHNCLNIMVDQHTGE